MLLIMQGNNFGCVVIVSRLSTEFVNRVIKCRILNDQCSAIGNFKIYLIVD